MWEAKLYLFINHHFLERRNNSIFVPGPPQYAHNHRRNFNDTQEERVNTSKNLLP